MDLAIAPSPMRLWCDATAEENYDIAGFRWENAEDVPSRTMVDADQLPSRVQYLLTTVQGTLDAQTAEIIDR